MASEKINKYLGIILLPITLRYRKLREESLINSALITQGLDCSNINNPRKKQVQYFTGVTQ